MKELDIIVIEFIDIIDDIHDFKLGNICFKYYSISGLHKGYYFEVNFSSFSDSVIIDVMNSSDNPMCIFKILRKIESKAILTYNT